MLIFCQHLEQPGSGPPPQILYKYMFWSEIIATDILIHAFCTESQDGPVGTGPAPQNSQKKKSKVLLNLFRQQYIYIYVRLYIPVLRSIRISGSYANLRAACRATRVAIVA